MKRTIETSKKKTSSIQTSRPHRLPTEKPKTPVLKRNLNITSSGAEKTQVPNNSQRKASTPTHDKTTRADSPDVSRILPTETSCSDSNNHPSSAKQVAVVSSKSAKVPKENLADQLDFEYTRYLQTVFRRKLAEAEASEMDDKLTALQKRIAENQNILEKTTMRLKNISFNKEVETLYNLQNRNYGQILETLDNANCKEYLEAFNQKLKQSQNQLRMRNVELTGGGEELLQIMRETLSACEKLKANNNLEVPKVLAELKASNDATSETLSRCLEMVPEVENLILDRMTFEIYAKNSEECNNQR